MLQASQNVFAVAGEADLSGRVASLLAATEKGCCAEAGAPCVRNGIKYGRCLNLDLDELPCQSSTAVLLAGREFQQPWTAEACVRRLLCAMSMLQFRRSTQCQHAKDIV
jgi:hypothetical protein